MVPRNGRGPVLVPRDSEGSHMQDEQIGERRVVVYGDPGFYSAGVADADGLKSVGGHFHYKRDALRHARTLAIEHGDLPIVDETETGHGG